MFWAIGLTSSVPYFPSLIFHFSSGINTDNNTRDYDHHGPAGPTAFWKISNEIDDNPSEEDHDDADDEGETEYEEVEVEVEVEVGVVGVEWDVGLRRSVF